MDSFLFIAGLLILSAAIRAAIGYPIRRPKSDDLTFETTWVTGYPAFSNGIIVTASNCMWVNVSEEKVTVRLHFPFSIVLLPELVGLGWEFPKEKLLSCSKTPLGVRVRYLGLISEREFVVHVGDKNGFIEAVSGANK